MEHLGTGGNGFSYLFNPYVPNAPFSYPLKSSENRNVLYQVVNCFHENAPSKIFDIVLKRLWVVTRCIRKL